MSEKGDLFSYHNIKKFDLSKTSKAKHITAIETFLHELANDPEFPKRHRAIHKRKLERDILEKYFIHNWTLSEIANSLKLSRNTITKFIHEYLMRHYDDTLVEEVSVMDAEGHLGIINSFFASVLFLAREAAFNAIFLRKVREEVAKSISERGVVETVKDRDLMRAWEQASTRLERYTKLTNEQLKVYIELMEKVLDKQRDIAMVRILYDYIRQLDDQAALKLNEALKKDEYARAVFESLSPSALVAVFRQRMNEAAFAQALEAKQEEIIDAIDVKELEEEVEEIIDGEEG